MRCSGAVKYAATLPFRTKSCYMKDMHVFERNVNGRRYRIAAQSVWDPVRGRSVARQTVLGPATSAPVADLAATRSKPQAVVWDRGTPGAPEEWFSPRVLPWWIRLP